MYANPVVLIIMAVLALTAGLVVLYLKWKPFHDIVNKTFEIFWRHPWAAALIPIIGQLIIMAKIMAAIYDHAHGIAMMVQHPIRSAQHGGILGAALHYGGYLLPGFANGGISSGGLAMVGERGPEIVHLPRASVVQPFSSNMLSGGMAIHVYPQDIYLDSKKIGTVLATAITDKEARR